MAVEVVTSKGRSVLKVPYAGRWTIEWGVVLDAAGAVVDVMPQSCGLPDGDEDPYGSYDLSSSFPSLCAAGGASVDVVAGEAASAFHRLQVAKAERRGGLLASDVRRFEQAGALRGLVVDDGRRRAEVVCALYGTPGGAAAAAEAKAEAEEDRVDSFGAATLSLADAPTILLAYDLSGCEKLPEGGFLALPRQSLPLTCEALAAPARGATAAADFVEAARTALSLSWRRRRNLCRAFLKQYVVVDLDGVDYGHCHVLLNLKVEKRLFLCVLTATFDAKFPESPPQLAIRNYCDVSEPRALPKDQYKYSPRWDGARMAKELHDHARRQIPTLFAPPPAPAAGAAAAPPPAP